MDYLLDTHTVIWFITNDPKLSLAAKNEIEDFKNKCLVSIASFWEMGIKHSLNRLDLGVDLEGIFDLIGKSGLETLPITQKQIIMNATLEFHHNDPFDRLMIAQAKSENLVLVSKDRIFSSYDIPLLW